MRAQPAPEPRQLALNNVEAEAALLGTLMSDNGRVDTIVDILRPEDFAEPVHGDIYQQILNLTAAGQQADMHTLRPAFVNDERMKRLGGASSYLAALTDGVLYLLAVKDTAAQLAELAARRRLLDTLERTKLLASDADTTIAEIVDAADAALVAAVERRETTPQATAGEAMTAALQRIEEIRANDGKVGVTCGISDIDEMLVGFEPGQMIVIGARPGMGKTAVANSIALGCAQRDAGVLFVSLEMSKDELGQRMLADLSFRGARGIDFDKIVRGTVNDDEFRQLARTAADMADLPLTIVDPGTMTTARLALGVRRHQRRFAASGRELKLVIVDYLQLLRPDGRYESAYQAVSEISRSLKALAKDARVTILALAQLNRGVEGRDDKRPGPADLRDSGQIEQDADALIFLHREEYYLRRNKPQKADKLDAWEEAISRCAGRIDFIMPKRRNGPEGSRRGYYFAHYQAVRGSDHYGEQRQEPML